MRLFRWQADLLRRVEPQHQLTAGVVMIDLSLLFVPYYFYTKITSTAEPLGIYAMSFLALFFAGVCCAWTAEVLINQQEDNDSK